MTTNHIEANARPSTGPHPVSLLPREGSGAPAQSALGGLAVAGEPSTRGMSAVGRAALLSLCRDAQRAYIQQAGRIEAKPGPRSLADHIDIARLLGQASEASRIAAILERSGA